MPVRLLSVCWHKHMFTFGFVASIWNQIISDKIVKFKYLGTTSSYENCMKE